MARDLLEHEHHAIRYVDDIHLVILPEWMGRTPAQWQADMSAAKVHPSRREIASALVRSGFDQSGNQVRPKSLSVIASDAGKDESSAKRFIRWAKAEGWLHHNGQYRELVAGKRHTPMYLLDSPAEDRGATDDTRAALDLEFGPMLDLFPMEDYVDGGTWGADHGDPPEWAR